ncbi:SAYSvFN domain-containing protein 1 [Denticeps clupeoides]|uniref:SAYSvFN domain-containing protein n=1 Tax=Denticeps clupeoides TaxID=299321 RepID=A0AAY4BT63_9TELE|nr:SAYSvFN domain-containing protein 1 [Denticeps clupeoides]
MERRLAEFRARKAEMANKTSERPRPDSSPNPPGPVTSGQNSPQEPNAPSSRSSSHWVPDWLLDSAVGRWLGTERFAVANVTLLKALLWLVLLGLFSELHFGLPFFLLSLFYWLYEGLRGPDARRPGELSAYSVFNPDCRPILGTLTAEQLEGEMGYRPLANR